MLDQINGPSSPTVSVSHTASHSNNEMPSGGSPGGPELQSPLLVPIVGKCERIRESPMLQC